MSLAMSKGCPLRISTGGIVQDIVCRHLKVITGVDAPSPWTTIILLDQTKETTI